MCVSNGVAPRPHALLDELPCEQVEEPRELLALDVCVSNGVAPRPHAHEEAGEPEDRLEDDGKSWEDDQLALDVCVSIGVAPRPHTLLKVWPVQDD